MLPLPHSPFLFFVCFFLRILTSSRRGFLWLLAPSCGALCVSFERGEALFPSTGCFCCWLQLLLHERDERRSIAACLSAWPYPSRLYFIPSILSPLSAYLCSSSSSGIKQHFSSHSLHHLVTSSSLTALLLCLPVCHLPHSRILSSQISVYSHTVTSPRPTVLFFARLPLRTHFRLPFAFYFPRSFSLFSLIPLFCNASARTFSFDPPSCLWQLKPSYPVSYLFRLHFLHISSTSTHFGIFNTSRDFTMLRRVRICPLFACWFFSLNFSMKLVCACTNFRVIVTLLFSVC